MKNYMLTALVFLTSGIMLYGQNNKSWLPSENNAIYRGKPYPQFDITELSGKHLTNKDCYGKTVLLSFWFEGCRGCREEFNDLSRLYDSLKNDPDCIFMSVSYDEPSSILEFANKYNIRYPIATGTQEQLHKMLCTGYPYISIIDRDGNTVFTGLATLGQQEKGGIPRIFTLASLLDSVRMAEHR